MDQGEAAGEQHMGERPDLRMVCWTLVSVASPRPSAALADQNRAASPFVCSPASTCSTNSDSAVACLASGATQPFYTDCFDFQAAQQGLCSSMGSKTGCW